MFNKCWRKRFYSNKQTWIQRRALRHTENCKILEFFFFLTFLQQTDEFSSAPPPRSWKDNSADQVFQTVGPTVKCNGNLPNLSALSRDAWPARTHALLYILQPCTEIQKYRHTEIHFTTLHGNTPCTATCNSASRQSGIVEAHFRDADNNQHRSFQGRETLPLIEDSTVRGFRVKVQQQEEEPGRILASCK